MPKIKTTFEARGILIEIHHESIGDGSKARISTIVANESATITDLVKASLAVQKQLSDKATKAKRKAAKKEKTKARKAAKPKVIAEARAPRKRKALVQTEMFPKGRRTQHARCLTKAELPEDQITPENMDERFPDEHYGCQAEQVPAPITANSCVMG